MKTVAAIFVFLTVVCLPACVSTTLKPDESAIFVATGKKLIKWLPASIEEEFTPEGFIVSWFTKDPKVTIIPGGSSIMFPADCRPWRIARYVRSNGRWVSDDLSIFPATPRAPSASNGEIQVFASKSIKELKTGAYVLEVLWGKAHLESYAFRIP